MLHPKKVPKTLKYCCTHFTRVLEGNCDHIFSLIFLIQYETFIFNEPVAFLNNRPIICKFSNLTSVARRRRNEATVNAIENKAIAFEKRTIGRAKKFVLPSPNCIMPVHNLSLRLGLQSTCMLYFHRRKTNPVSSPHVQTLDKYFTVAVFSFFIVSVNSTVNNNNKNFRKTLYLFKLFQHVREIEQ